VGAVQKIRWRRRADEEKQVILHYWSINPKRTSSEGIQKSAKGEAGGGEQDRGGQEPALTDKGGKKGGEDRDLRAGIKSRLSDAVVRKTHHWRSSVKAVGERRRSSASTKQTTPGLEAGGGIG